MTTEKSKLEETIGKMAGDQLAGLKAAVDAEEQRRKGDASRAHRMNDTEFRQWSQDQIEAGDKARAKGARANG